MMEMRFWAAEDIELADDHQHFVQLAGKQQSLVLQILCLLRTNDDFLQQSAVARLAKDIQSPEARCFFGYVLMQRNIHAEVLDNALRALGGSETQINHTHLLEAAVARTYCLIQYLVHTTNCNGSTPTLQTRKSTLQCDLLRLPSTPLSSRPQCTTSSSI